MTLGIKYQSKRLYIPDSFPFEIVEISGLNPPAAAIASSPLAGMNGELVTNSRLTKRNIVITLNLLPPLFKARRELYRIFTVGSKIKLFFKEHDLNVTAEGYVESVEFSLFSQNQLPVISILCPDPFLYDVEPKKYSDITNGITTENNGCTVGATFRVSFNQSSNSVTINNGDQHLTVNYSFISTDILEITTHEGNKRIRVERGSVIYDITSALANGSDWIQLTPGTNTLTASGGCKVSLSYTQRYTGV